MPAFRETSGRRCSSRSSASATAREPTYDGIGLGLAVTKGFVEAMGGEINVEDTPGGGTTVVITLEAPAVRALVVEDDPRIGKTLEVNLRARGYDADVAVTGEQALQLAARHHPDVVILDLGLPGMDGLDVVRGLRGWTPVPIVVLSGRGSEAAKVEALDLGADDYLTKPFGMDELFARLRAAMRRAVLPEGKAVVTTPDFTLDFAAKQVHRERRAHPAHADAVAHRRSPRAQRRSSRHVRAAPPGGVGPDLREGDQLPPRLHDADPQGARARTVATPLLHHRTRTRVPVRASGRAEPRTTTMAEVVAIRWPEEREDAARLTCCRRGRPLPRQGRRRPADPDRMSRGLGPHPR